MIFTIESDSSEHTRQIGKAFAKFLDPGDVILLSGELGGGKTTFISGAARGLNISQNISSPSFTLINVYDFVSNNKKLKMAHCDLYRISNVADIIDIGLEDFIYNENTITFIEWAEKIKDNILKNFLEIYFEYYIPSTSNESEANIENQKRKITLVSNSSYWDKKISQYIAAIPSYFQEKDSK